MNFVATNISHNHSTDPLVALLSIIRYCEMGLWLIGSVYLENMTEQQSEYRVNIESSKIIMGILISRLTFSSEGDVKFY